MFTLEKHGEESLTRIFASPASAVWRWRQRARSATEDGSYVLAGVEIELLGADDDRAQLEEWTSFIPKRADPDSVCHLLIDRLEWAETKINAIEAVNKMVGRAYQAAPCYIITPREGLIELQRLCCWINDHPDQILGTPVKYSSVDA